MKDELITYKNVDICQDDLYVLTNVNLNLFKKDFVYLIGKVGTGKTTLFKTFYGELPIDSGEAKVLDYDLLSIKNKQFPFLRRRLGIVFQDFQLLIDRSVRDNLEFVLKATGWNDKRLIKERIEEVLTLVDMKNKGYKFPSELSGGEQQRIVIARAMLNSPEIILADEPTGNLDEETSRAIVTLLREISEKGTLVIMTTHDLSIPKNYPGKIYCCANHKLNNVTEEFYSS